MSDRSRSPRSVAAAVAEAKAAVARCLPRHASTFRGQDSTMVTAFAALAVAEAAVAAEKVREATEKAGLPRAASCDHDAGGCELPEAGTMATTAGGHRLTWAPEGAAGASAAGSDGTRPKASPAMSLAFPKSTSVHGSDSKGMTSSGHLTEPRCSHMSDEASSTLASALIHIGGAATCLEDAADAADSMARDMRSANQYLLNACDRIHEFRRMA